MGYLTADAYLSMSHALVILVSWASFALSMVISTGIVVAAARGLRFVRGMGTRSQKPR
jgi:hypothetical protein